MADIDNEVQDLENQEVDTSATDTPVVEDEVVDTDGSESAVEEGAADTLKPGAGSGGAGDSRAAKVADLVGLLVGLKDEDLNNFHASIAQIGKEADPIPGGTAEKNKNSISAKASAATKKLTKESLDEMFKGDETISEDFRNKASTLFEAAVSIRVASEVEAIEEELKAEKDEAIQGVVAEFAARLDSYLDHVAEKYVEDNKLAIESGLRAELSESFIAGLKKVFEEHYITMPEDKVDVVEQLTSQVEDLEDRLNASIAENIRLTEATEDAARAEVVAELTEGMTESDREKFVTLANDIEASDIEDFTAKAGLVKENFFGAVSESIEDTGLVLSEAIPEEGDEVVEGAKPTGRMAKYADAISRNSKYGQPLAVNG